MALVDNCTQTMNSRINIVLNNIENRKIIYKVYQKYKKYINEDDFHSIKLIAIWKCLEKHNPAKSKFTSYLYNCIKWECCNKLRENKDSFDKLPNNSCYYIDDNNDVLDCLNINDKNLIIQKYIYKKTLKEIGVEIGLSSEGVRRRLNKAKDRLKNAFRSINQ